MIATPGVWAAAWTVESTTGSPGRANPYGGAIYNRWTQALEGWWPSVQENANDIYSTSYQLFNLGTGAWTERFFNGDTSTTGCNAETATNPSSGHPGRMFDFDWRHQLFFLHFRLANNCPNTSTALFSWLEDLAHLTTGWPSSGPWHRELARGAPTTGINQERHQGVALYDPLNNWIIEFWGVSGGSTVLNSATKYVQSTNTATCMNNSGSGGCSAYANTAPTESAGRAVWFDYKYADANLGEVRYGHYAGYTTPGSNCPTAVDFFYPNGSAAQSLAANSWQTASVTGTGPAVAWNCALQTGGEANYGYAIDYDTLRDVLWVYKSSSTISKLACSGTANTCTWTDYAVTDSSGIDCPSGNCNMIYDAAHDKLIITGQVLSGNVFKVLSLDLQTVVSASRTAGAYPTSTTSTLIQRPIAYPAINVSYTDPLGATVKRVTSVTPGATAPRAYDIPIYAQIKPTDKSEDFFITVSGRVLHISNNYHDLGMDLSASFRGGNYIWSRTQNAVITGMDSNTTTTFKKCTVTTSGSGGSETGSLTSCTTLADLSANYQTCAGTGSPNMGFSSEMNQVSQQDRDKDDKYVILTCQKNSVAEIVMIVVNLLTGVSGKEYPIASGPYVLSACTAGNPTVCTSTTTLSTAITASTQVLISSAAGGSWASLNGQRTISSASGTTLTLSFNSTGFGTYTGSSGSAGVYVPYNGGCSPRFGPNFAWTGYLGAYAIVEWGIGNAGNNRQCGVETFNLANAANPSGSWDFAGQVVPDSTHFDLAVVSGVEYLVAFAAGGSWGSLAGNIVRCALPNGFGAGTCIKMLDNPNGGGHISAHAFNAPTPFVIWSHDEVGAGITDGVWNPYHGEIIKLYWDSTAASPHIERLLHTRSTPNWLVACSCQATSYWALAKPTLNLDGTKAWFASTWGPVDGVNTYEVTLGLAPRTSLFGNIKIMGNTKIQ